MKFIKAKNKTLYQYFWEYAFNTFWKRSWLYIYLRPEINLPGCLDFWGEVLRGLNFGWFFIIESLLILTLLSALLKGLNNLLIFYLLYISCLSEWFLLLFFKFLLWTVILLDIICNLYLHRFFLLLLKICKFT